MSEPTHALDHHMKMAADRAIAYGVEDRHHGRTMLDWRHIADRAYNRLKSLKGIQTDEGRAECMERAAGLLLRAAVWLRRSK